MTKPGYTHVSIPKSLHSVLKENAGEQKISIGKYIENLIHSDSLTVGHKALWGLVPLKIKNQS